MSLTTQQCRRRIWKIEHSFYLKNDVRIWKHLFNEKSSDPKPTKAYRKEKFGKAKKMTAFPKNDHLPN